MSTTNRAAQFRRAAYAFAATLNDNGINDPEVRAAIGRCVLEMQGRWSREVSQSGDRLRAVMLEDCRASLAAEVSR